MPLTNASKQFLKKFNICLINYNASLLNIKNDFIDSEENLQFIDDIINNLDLKKEHPLILHFVINKLKSFSTTYKVNIENIDDFKIIYFIALYFLLESDISKNHQSKSIILIVLHQIMCSRLLAYQPKIILDKLKEFIQTNSYEKFYEEYGDIGYYHTIKSIYLMQEFSAKLLLDEEELKDNSTVSAYFLRLKHAK